MLNRFKNSRKDKSQLGCNKEEDSFSPIAKIKNDKQYSIINDHLGTPIEAYADDGKLIWERSLNSNGKVLKETGFENFCQFLYQGQSYDSEIELAYNRFRYYDPEEGRYISQDPIGLLSGEFGFYNYVENSNNELDIFGLSSYRKMKKDGSGLRRKPGPKKKKGRKKKSKHGNSKDYDGTTYLYKRYDAEGNFQKHGISNDPNTRYSDVELNGGSVVTVDSGTRKAMLKKERHLVETDPGPLNKEPWAGINLGG